MYNVKFADPSIDSVPLEQIVASILCSGKFIKGERNKKFSEEWANYCGADYCVPTSSGTAALTATLKAIKPSHSEAKCIVPEYSFVATASAAYHAGYTPIYCKVENNGLMNQEHCLELLHKHNVHAVIVVHLYGQRVDILPEIINKVPVIEDACQAHGAVREVQGAAACFSFYPSKNLGAAGDAGAMVTNIKGLAHWVEMYCNYGDPPGRKYEHEIIGDNLRMDEIQAAILSAKLKYLDEEIRIRYSQVAIYAQLGIDPISNYESNSWHLYPILATDAMERAELYKTLREEGIEVGNHYPYTLPDKVPGIKANGLGEFIADRVVTLPIGSYLTETAIRTVGETLHKVATNRKGFWSVD